MLIKPDNRGAQSAARHAGDALLWLLAAGHGLVFVVFLLTLLLISTDFARAADKSCGGANLLTAMKRDDPAAYAAIESEAAAVPNGRGLFWKVEKPGIEPSHLLGTMHVTDPRVLAMPKGASQALDQASVIVVESDEILDERKAAAAMLLKPELSMFTDGTQIADHLSPEDTKQLEAGLKGRGLSLAALSRMKPWIIAAFVALPPCELQRKAGGASFLDKKIAESALAAGKPVKGLETMAEQLGAMAELPISLHLKALIDTLALGDRMPDIMETMTELYLTGDTGMTIPMLKAVTPGDEADEGYVAFEKRIVEDRNKVMAERAAPLLEKGGVFMAVGALHLPGPDGLVELLRRQGYTVTTVN